MGGVDRLHGQTSHAAGHAALVVGVYRDEVADPLGEAVDRGSGVPYDLPMGMELIGRENIFSLLWRSVMAST